MLLQLIWANNLTYPITSQSQHRQQCQFNNKSAFPSQQRQQHQHNNNISLHQWSLIKMIHIIKKVVIHYSQMKPYLKLIFRDKFRFHYCWAIAARASRTIWPHWRFVEWKWEAYQCTRWKSTAKWGRNSIVGIWKLDGIRNSQWLKLFFNC